MITLLQSLTLGVTAFPFLCRSSSSGFMLYVMRSLERWNIIKHVVYTSSPCILFAVTHPRSDCLPIPLPFLLFWFYALCDEIAGTLEYYQACCEIISSASSP